jgi:hypothetical protein
MVFDPVEMKFVAQIEEGRRQAEEGQRRAEGANRQLIIGAIQDARARTNRRLDEIDDTPLIEEMQRWRLASPRTVPSRWLAADRLKAKAKPAKPGTKPESLRRRLIGKHEDKYPGDW